MTIVIEVTEAQILITLVCVLFITIIRLCLVRKKRGPTKNGEGTNRGRGTQPRITESGAGNVEHDDVEITDEQQVTDSYADAEYLPAFTLAKAIKPTVILLQQSKCILQGSPSIYKVPVKIMRTITAGIEKAEVGTPHPTPKPTRVFMAVGATGAGKSTLINGMLNYIMGVKFEDDCRLKLITDEIALSQAHSQTQKITSYTIYWHEESPVDYNLIIVDTPGFGDTRGIERDKQITAQIKEFFSLRGDAGIDQIHGIGFVTQSSMARLTPTQKYVFDSVLSIFGKDIKNNIFIMSTFADGSEPAVKGAIEAARIPYCKLLQFNSEPLFAGNTNQFSKIFWDMVYKSFKEFFINFAKTNAVSLQLTREVLKEREHLECIVSGLQQQIKNGMAKIDELNQEKQVLKAHEADILKNKDFTYKVTVCKQRKVSICDTFVTNCQKCNFTCHKYCHISNDNQKHNCAAMDSVGNCRTCPGKCHWTMHHNNSYYFETYEEEEERTSKHLKANFQNAIVRQSGIQEMIVKLEQELQDFHNQVLANIKQVRQCLQRLAEIALKPNPITDSEYIDLLIQVENNEKKPGFMRRITYLKVIKQQVEQMARNEDLI